MRGSSDVKHRMRVMAADGRGPLLVSFSSAFGGFCRAGRIGSALEGVWGEDPSSDGGA